MKIDANNPRHWLLLCQQAFFTLLAIAARPLRKAPDRPLVILYGHQLSGNLKALYSAWEKSGHAGFDLYFLCLDPHYSDDLERAGVQVLRCHRLADMLRLSQASILVSDHGLHLMGPLLYFTNLVFIDVWHGIPFKGFTPRDFKAQHRYDEVWVSSPLLKQLYTDRFGFKPARVRSLGYARTDRLFKRTDNGSEFRNRAALGEEQKVVLYAPTWQQDDSGRELFPFGEPGKRFIRALAGVCAADNAVLLLRSHLNTEMAGEALANVRLCSQRDFPDTEEILLATDILICDWSSIAFDFLALRRPTIFLDVPPPFKNGLSLGTDYRFGSVVADMHSLEECLGKYLADPATYDYEHGATCRRITAQVYGDNTDGAAATRQLQRLAQLLAGNRAGAGTEETGT